MTITLVCSCGLLLSSGGSKLLIDAPNGPQAPFYELQEHLLQALILARPPFDGPLALAFTHTHPDHFCRDRLLRILQARPETPVFLPDNATPEDGKLRLGGFTLEFHSFPHTPVPDNLMVRHVVLLIEQAGHRVYITADAAPDAARHEQILHGRRCDTAFWNGQYLSHADTRALLPQAAAENLIYHIPIDPQDVSGIRRKCKKNMLRFSQQLSGVRLLEQYPAQIICKDPPGTW